MSEEAENEQLTIRIKDGVSALSGGGGRAGVRSAAARPGDAGDGGGHKLMAGDVLVFVMGFDPARKHIIDAFLILAMVW